MAVARQLASEVSADRISAEREYNLKLAVTEVVSNAVRTTAQTTRSVRANELGSRSGRFAGAARDEASTGGIAHSPTVEPVSGRGLDPSAPAPRPFSRSRGRRVETASPVNELER